MNHLVGPILIMSWLILIIRIHILMIYNSSRLLHYRFLYMNQKGSHAVKVWFSWQPNGKRRLSCSMQNTLTSRISSHTQICFLFIFSSRTANKCIKFLQQKLKWVKPLIDYIFINLTSIPQIYHLHDFKLSNFPVLALESWLHIYVYNPWKTFILTRSVNFQVSL